MYLYLVSYINVWDRGNNIFKRFINKSKFNTNYYVYDDKVLNTDGRDCLAYRNVISLLLDIKYCIKAQREINLFIPLRIRVIYCDDRYSTFFHV